MKITAKDLLGLKIIDEIIKEPLGGAHYDYAKVATNIKTVLNKYLNEYDGMSGKKVAEERYLKFRNIGIYEDVTKFKNNRQKATKKKIPKR